MRSACVTHYEALYGRHYYAHKAGESSFGGGGFVGKLLARVSEDAPNCGFLDIGGGSGLLAQALKQSGRRCFTIDAQERASESFRQVDLACVDDAVLQEIRSAAQAWSGLGYVATCLDVAEHIDPEHLADFLINLNELTAHYLIISISTRPSSRSNSFHSTILPASSWKSLLEASGFEVTQADSLSERLINEFGCAEMAVRRPFGASAAC